MSPYHPGSPYSRVRCCPLFGTPIGLCNEQPLSSPSVSASAMQVFGLLTPQQRNSCSLWTPMIPLCDRIEAPRPAMYLLGRYWPSHGLVAPRPDSTLRKSDRGGPDRSNTLERSGAIIEVIYCKRHVYMASVAAWPTMMHFVPH